MTDEERRVIEAAIEWRKLERRAFRTGHPMDAHKEYLARVNLGMLVEELMIARGRYGELEW